MTTDNFRSQLMALHYVDVYTTLVHEAKGHQLCWVLVG